MKTCTSDISTRFLSGLLTATESAEFENHLESCPHCVERLEQEAGGEAGWQSARDLLVHNVPKTENWISSEDTPSNRSLSESEWMPACTSSAILSILAPTDDPAFVGRIGTYEVSGVIGRGSAGIVLRGFDRALHRNVAIKVLDPSMADVGAARQRFAREARAMAAISHEHVVPVYEVSEHDGVPFFVMEYVPGGSLERRLRSDGPFDVASIVRIGLQTAQALAAAHAHGLVHRDIKPGNILIDRGTERVRVADFGLVRVANDVSCTRSGFIAGTPQYMAPEQVKAEICDGRSDLFSLGSLMYALCTGHAPFRADTVYGVLQRIVNDVPRSIRDANSLVPEWLEEFIFRLMSKNRDDRFATADQVVEALQLELALLQNPGIQTEQSRSRRQSYSATKIPRMRAKTAVRSGMIIIVAASISLMLGVSWQFGANRWLPIVGKQLPDQHHVNPDGTPETSPAAAALWGSDETTLSAAQTAAKLLETDLYTPQARMAPDPWETQADEISKELTAIEAELRASSAKSSQ